MHVYQGNKKNESGQEESQAIDVDMDPGWYNWPTGVIDKHTFYVSGLILF